MAGDGRKTGRCMGHAWYEIRWPGSCAEILEHRAAPPTFVAVDSELRAFVRWRKRCIGSRSERGKLFAERLVPVAHTAREQRMDVVAFLSSVLPAARPSRPPSHLIVCILSAEEHAITGVPKESSNEASERTQRRCFRAAVGTLTLLTAAEVLIDPRCGPGATGSDSAGASGTHVGRRRGKPSIWNQRSSIPERRWSAGVSRGPFIGFMVRPPVSTTPSPRSK